MLLVATLLAPIALTISPAQAQDGSSVRITGHGWGHGRGLGQYGAKGYADAGGSYTGILNHFYGGTTMGSAGNSEISVWLKGQDNKVLRIFEDDTFTVDGNTISGGGTVQIAQEGSVWVLRRAPHVPGTNCRFNWEGSPIVLSDAATATVTVTSSIPDPGVDHWNMLAICDDAGALKHYRGRLQIVKHQNISRVVNLVSVEGYLKGVVPRESPASWNIEALKAQAVAARSYALSEGGAGLRFPPYAKTCDDTQCQVYGGAASTNTSDVTAVLEHPNTNAAIDQTAGQVRKFSNGATARTEFSSSTGGWTSGTPQCSACSFPSVVDDGDATPSNPNHNWSVDIAKSLIESKWAIGSFTGVEILSRNGLGAEGGRVLQMKVNGTGGSQTITGDQFRIALGLKSNWFSVGGASEPPPRPTCGYSDVFQDDQFCNDITWLTEEDIANGYPDGSFRPIAPVSRQAMAAFLYRFVTGNGDAPACTAQPFSDVPIADQFCGEIAWLAGSGITGGFEDGTFKQLDPVSRQAMASFLYRVKNGAADAPGCGGQPFNDVPAADQFCGEIKWLSDVDIAQGYADGGFHPTAAVSRQAMARFLHKVPG